MTFRFFFGEEIKSRRFAPPAPFKLKIEWKGKFYHTLPQVFLSSLLASEQKGEVKHVQEVLPSFSILE